MKSTPTMPPAMADIVARAQSMACAMNLLALFASPRVVARILAERGELPTPELVIEHLEALVETAPGSTFEVSGSPRRAFSEVVPTIRAVQRLFEGWDRSEGVSLELQEGARQLLQVLDVPTPPCGWDDYEGPPPKALPEPEDPDPRPPPTEAELAARPDVVRFHAATMWFQYLASPKMVAKIPSAALRRPALGHIDNFLASFRPLRSTLAQNRAKWLALIERLEDLRALCEAWDGVEALPAPVQETVREVLRLSGRSDTQEAYEAFEDDVNPVYLEPPESPGT